MQAMICRIEDGWPLKILLSCHDFRMLKRLVLKTSCWVLHVLKSSNNIVFKHWKLSRTVEPLKNAIWLSVESISKRCWKKLQPLESFGKAVEAIGKTVHNLFISHWVFTL